ncbi:MAG: indole-3-glycerol-phosphate synthase [Thermoprotei archaeon]|jgi:indole-3-glycerol phosphate synthase
MNFLKENKNKIKKILIKELASNPIKINYNNRCWENLTSSIKKWESKTGIAIIAEYKRASPTGIINLTADLKNYYQELSDLVAGFSILVNKEWFMGSPAYIAILREIGWKGPILAKGFIFYKKQIENYATLGATSILLIPKALGHHELINLYEYSIKKSVEPLIEVNNFKEAVKIIEILSPKIIGVNARDLETLTIDKERMFTTISMLRKEYPDLFIIAESGLKDPEDAVKAMKFGADAYLIGTELMRNSDRRSFLNKIYNKTLFNTFKSL